MLQKVLKGIVWGGLFLLPFVPVVISSSMFFPFITGKAFAFRIITEVIFAAWLCLLLVDHSYRPKKSWVLIAISIFVLVVGLADAFGVHPLRSFWSNYERMEGFITILHLVGLFFVAGSVLKKENQWSALWNTSVAVSVVLSVKGFSELGEGVYRIDATLGNPTYFAVYLLFHVFLTAWLLYKNRSSKALTITYIVLITMQLVALYQTGTRGTLLGLVAGLIVTALYVLVFGSAHTTFRRLSAGGLIAGMLCIGGFFALRTSAVIQESPILSRLANISLQDETTESRITLWSKIALPALKERPILGWGQDNFIIVFGTYYDPIMYKQEPWFDRAHNVFVDWLMAAGILGLLSYLFLFGAGIWMLIRTHLSVPEKAIVMGLFAGYGVHNFFVFDNLVSYVFFILVLAWVHSLYVHRDAVPVKVMGNHEPSTMVKAVCAGVCVIAVGLVWGLNIRGIGEAQTLLQAIRAEREQQSHLAAYDFYEEKFSGGWLGLYEAREQFTQMMVRASVVVPSSEDMRVLQERAEEELLKGIAEDPRNTRQYSFLAYLYRHMEEFEKAAATLEQALEFNGTRQIFLQDLAEVYDLQGRTNEALGVYERAFRADETNSGALGFFVAALSAAGRDTEARALLDEHAGLNLAGIAKMYAQNKQFIQAAELYEKVIASGSATAEVYATLGVVYIELNQRNNALRIFEELERLYPGAYGDQVSETIQAIKDGRPIVIE